MIQLVLDVFLMLTVANEVLYLRSVCPGEDGVEAPVADLSFLLSTHG